MLQKIVILLQFGYVKIKSSDDRSVEHIKLFGSFRIFMKKKTSKSHNTIGNKTKIFVQPNKKVTNSRSIVEIVGKRRIVQKLPKIETLQAQKCFLKTEAANF